MARVLTLLVVSDKALGHGLADGVDLGHVAAALHANAHVHVGELLLADNEDGLVALEAEALRLEELERLAVHVDEATAALGVGDRHRVLLAAVDLHRVDLG